MEVIIRARPIAKGTGTGPLLVTDKALSFLSGVDPASGVVIEQGHPLEGRSIAATVLAFPFGKGSTVGSYVMYALQRNGRAPAAIINHEAEPIVAVGAIIAGIPMIDRPEIPFAELKSGTIATVDGTDGSLRMGA